jgi:hypothetical protein
MKELYPAFVLLILTVIAGPVVTTSYTEKQTIIPTKLPTKHVFCMLFEQIYNQIHRFSYMSLLVKTKRLNDSGANIFKPYYLIDHQGKIAISEEQVASRQGPVNFLAVAAQMGRQKRGGAHVTPHKK